MQGHTIAVRAAAEGHSVRLAVLATYMALNPILDSCDPDPTEARDKWPNRERSSGLRPDIHVGLDSCDASSPEEKAAESDTLEASYDQSLSA